MESEMTRDDNYVGLWADLLAQAEEEEETFELDPHWCVAEGRDKSSCVLMLAGRAQHANLLPSIYWHNGFQDCLLVGIATKNLAWYPMPRGAGDQMRAANGIPHAINLIESAVEKIHRKWKIPKSKIVLLGFSAGGVMSVQVAGYSDQPYAGVVGQSGAILQPTILPYRESADTPVLLTHSKDDETFSWDERYLPMRAALKSKSYPLSCVESQFGGHSLNPIDISVAKIFIRQVLA